MFKKFKKTKLAIVLAVALIMCFGSVATVFASDYTPVTGTPQNPAQAGITKILQTPYGTTIPSNMTFNFVVTSVSLNGIPVGDPEWPAGITMPQLGTAGAVAIPVTDANMTTTSGVTTRIMESGNLLGAINWPSTGIFEFTIVETANFLPYVQNQNIDILESYVFSQAQFTLRVHVGEYDGVRYVRYTYALRTHNDDGTPGSGKLDPTPGTSNTQGDHSQVIFNNRYWRTTDQDTDTDEGPLVVSKTVTGTGGSLTNPFSFSITLGLNATLFPTPNPFVAYIYDADDDRVSGPHNFTRDAAGNVTGTFTLRHGERLVFQNTPVGTQFNVTETAVFGYTTSILVNGVSINPGLTTADRFVLEAGSTAAFTNNNVIPPPTGIALSDLPFYGMIALAIGGLVMFIIVKAKKHKSYN